MWKRYSCVEDFHSAKKIGKTFLQQTAFSEVEVCRNNTMGPKVYDEILLLFPLMRKIAGRQFEVKLKGRVLFEVMSCVIVCNEGTFDVKVHRNLSEMSSCLHFFFWMETVGGGVVCARTSCLSFGCVVSNPQKIRRTLQMLHVCLFFDSIWHKTSLVEVCNWNHETCMFVQPCSLFLLIFCARDERCASTFEPFGTAQK